VTEWVGGWVMAVFTSENSFRETGVSPQLFSPALSP